MNSPTASAAIPTATLEIYRQRRARVLEAMRAAGGGIALIPTAPTRTRNRDSEHPYRHDSYFYYLTGFNEPEAFLVLNANPNLAHDAPASLLFCRTKDEAREIWEGFHYGPAAAREIFGFDAAYSIDELDEHLPQLMHGAQALYYALGTCRKLDTQVRSWLKTVRAQSRNSATAPRQLHDVTSILNEMRLLKDEHELNIMRRAARISVDAHKRVLQMCRPGMYEYELEAELLHEFRRQGAQAPAYNSIVAAGAHACILHYPAGYGRAHNGDLVLIDAACELDGYAADITRTFPISGHFSAPQRELYEIVLAAQQAAVSAIGVGVPFNEPHMAAVRVLAQGMLDTGLLNANQHGSVEDVIEKNAYKRFYMHGTSHWLGMDVHDCGDYRLRPTSNHGLLGDLGAGSKTEAEPAWRNLAANMVLTIEPGLYVRAAEDVPEKYWNLGIRIEDDAIVTTQGCELITRDLPVSIEEIEALMRGN